jgi:hypothetical protein
MSIQILVITATTAILLKECIAEIQKKPTEKRINTLISLINSIQSLNPIQRLN